MELLGIEDVMEICKVGRPTAMRYLADKNCPTLPRRKGQPYKVERGAFERWLENGGYQKK